MDREVRQVLWCLAVQSAVRHDANFVRVRLVQAHRASEAVNGDAATSLYHTCG